MAVKTDRLISIHGPVTSGGNYLRTTTVAAKVFRRLLSWKTCKAWERAQQAADNPQTIRDFINDFEVALEVLVSSGAIHTVVISTERTRKGRVFRVAWKSALGVPDDVVITDPLSLNE
jgi:hypothetical protein